jgi:O-antigen/teichoic acid export membrane protein
MPALRRLCAIIMLDYFLKDSFRRNSILYVSAVALSDLIGFVFWIVAARYYQVVDVGFATALLASVNLIFILSRLGLDVGLVRFIHDEVDKASLINTSLTVVGIAAVTLSVVFIGGLNIWSAALKPILGEVPVAALFVLLALLFSLFWILNAAFLAFRSAHFSLIQIAILGLRIVVVIPLVALGVAGILSAYTIAIGAAVIFAFFTLSRVRPGYRPVPTIKKSAIAGMFTFNLGNYFADTFRMLPGLVLPILIVNLVNAESSAYFYMAWMAGATIFGISAAVNTVFLAETVADQERIGPNVVKAAKLLALLVGSLVVLTLVFGKWLLWLFGVNYAGEGAALLSLLAVTAIPLTVNEVFIALKKLEKNVVPIVCIRIFIATTTIAGGLWLSQRLGINGIGIALLASQTLVAIILFPQLVRIASSRSREK